MCTGNIYLKDKYYDPTFYLHKGAMNKISIRLQMQPWLHEEWKNYSMGLRNARPSKSNSYRVLALNRKTLRLRKYK